MEKKAKTKVVAFVWGAKFIQFLAVPAVLFRSIWKKRMNSTFSLKSTEANRLSLESDSLGGRFFLETNFLWSQTLLGVQNSLESDSSWKPIFLGVRLSLEFYSPWSLTLLGVWLLFETDFPWSPTLLEVRLSLKSDSLWSQILLGIRPSLESYFHQVRLSLEWDSSPPFIGVHLSWNPTLLKVRLFLESDSPCSQTLHGEGLFSESERWGVIIPT